MAAILADMHMDHQSLMAAMLHDVIEDTGIEKTAIGTQFGPTVAELVDGVSKYTWIVYNPVICVFGCRICCRRFNDP